MKKQNLIALAIAVIVLQSGCDQLNDLFAKTRLPITVTAWASVNYSNLIFGARISQPIPNISVEDNVLAPYMDFQISMNWDYPDIDYGDTVTFTIT